MNRRAQIEAILAGIPRPAWDRIQQACPETANFRQLLERMPDGPGAVLMLAVGLNAFQLKGEPESGYWRAVPALVEASLPLDSPSRMEEVLGWFYGRDRLHPLKLRRLARFLRSPLALDVWRSSRHKLIRDIPGTWRGLAQTMRQSPGDKTIAFAMKCMAARFVALGAPDVDFPAPIPVDSRVVRFTKKTALCRPCTPRRVQAAWAGVLRGLRRAHQDLTMVHLDSLVWQIGALEGDGLRAYFRALGLRRIGAALDRLAGRRVRK